MVSKIKYFKIAINLFNKYHTSINNVDKLIRFSYMFDNMDRMFLPGCRKPPDYEYIIFYRLT